MKKLFILIILSCYISIAYSQNNKINTKYLTEKWDAWWITHPKADIYNYGVFHFRKDFSLQQIPDEFIIHVSADNRYRLYVNGEYIVQGPARGDFQSWFYETVDISSHLKQGENCIAAQVWNAGEYRPLAQISDKLAFIIQGNSETEHMVNTNDDWSVIRNNAYFPNIYLDNDPKLRWQYYVAGVMDSIAMEEYPRDWEKPAFDASHWSSVRLLDQPYPQDYNYHHKWVMTPRVSALLEEDFQRFAKIARTEGVEKYKDFVSGNSPITIPANTKASILFDMGILYNTVPELIVGKGKGTKIIVTYAEALRNKNHKKEHRDKLEGMHMFGVHDIFMPDGSSNQKFVPLWTRPFRWVQFDIETKDEALILNDYYTHTIQYPTKIKASFECGDDMLHNIWDASVHTQVLSAQETFVSDLGYEQIQYAGDTKVQELCYFYMTGNEELFKLALKQFNDSREGIGLTQSRYPCHLTQFAPLYSLVWISMCHDYLMLGEDPEYLKQFLPAINEVLSYYQNHLNEDGMSPTLGYIDYIDYGFTAQRKAIRNEKPNQGSTIHSFAYAYALREAAAIYSYFGDDCNSTAFLEQADKIVNSLKTNAFDAKSGYYSDSPSLHYFSQHSNILAVLADAIPKEEQAEFIKSVYENPNLKETQMYFHFYLGRAINKAGAGDMYLKTIDAWRNLIDLGVKSFGEIKDVSPRSECHAWSTSPAYEFLATICGVQPSSPGYKTVEIKPNLGNLDFVKSKIPHHNGMIEIDLKKKGGKLKGNVVLPADLTGEFVWNGKKVNLKEGENKISF